jgi:hypothetical protein
MIRTRWPGIGPAGRGGALRIQGGLSGTMFGMGHLRSVDQLADRSVVRWVVGAALVVVAVAASLPSLHRGNAHPLALAVLAAEEPSR